MSHIAPTTALEALYRDGRIAYEQMRDLSDRHPFVVNEAMEAVEKSPAFLEALAVLVDEIERRAGEQEEAESILRADPRYARAPEVKGIFVRQFWDAGDYLTEVGRDEFTVPLPYLVANRERLREVRDYGDSDWLAFDLGLDAGHEGPFDMDDIEDSIAAWLEATPEGACISL